MTIDLYQLAKAQMHPSWHPVLLEEFEKDYMHSLQSFLNSSDDTIYPTSEHIFRALSVPLPTVRGVIVGQDPYHGPGQAMGLAFSVPADVRIPPSLRRIFTEIHNDIGCDIPSTGDLTPWVEREGLLLLNSVLTVQAHQAASHAKHGWERLTDVILHAVNQQQSPTVFFLWGKYAQSKGDIITAEQHLVLEAPHPSPLAQGFLGCRHFSTANAFLQEQGLDPINWEL